MRFFVIINFIFWILCAIFSYKDIVAPPVLLQNEPLAVPSSRPLNRIRTVALETSTPPDSMLSSPTLVPEIDFKQNEQNEPPNLSTKSDDSHSDLFSDINLIEAIDFIELPSSVDILSAREFAPGVLRGSQMVAISAEIKLKLVGGINLSYENYIPFSSKTFNFGYTRTTVYRTFPLLSPSDTEISGGLGLGVWSILATTTDEIEDIDLKIKKDFVSGMLVANRVSPLGIARVWIKYDGSLAVGSRASSSIRGDRGGADIFIGSLRASKLTFFPRASIWFERNQLEKETSHSDEVSKMTVKAIYIGIGVGVSWH